MSTIVKRLTAVPRLPGLAAFIVLLTGARIAVLVATPLNLGPDEAQYWSWSLTPAFGYFSKPPMIAWIIGGSTAICGDGEACIRLGAPLLHAATAFAVFLLGRALFDERIGVWSAVTYALMPGTSFSSLLITTDVPLLFFWALALLALVRLQGGAGVEWALTLGAAVGLGLLSKYAMLYFLLCAAIAFLPTAAGRSLVFSRTGLIASLSAAAVFAPNIIWNTLHDFATVGHTASNANWGGSNPFNPINTLTFLGAQVGIIGPVAAGIVIWALIRRLPDPEHRRRDILLLSFSLPILAIVAIQALISRSNANWAAPAFVALSIFVSAWAVRNGRTRLLAANTGVNLALGLVVAILSVSPPFVAAIGQDNSVKRLRGWPEAGHSIERHAAAAPFQAILCDDREDMGSLFYYTRARKVPLRMWPNETPSNEYETAHALRGSETSNVLFVTRKTDPARVTSAFASATRIATLETRLDSKRKRIFFLYALEGPVSSDVFLKFFNRPSTD